MHSAMKVYFISGIVFCWLSCGSSSQQTNQLAIPKKDTIPAISGMRTGDTLSIVAVGDIMFGSNYPDAHLLPPNDGKDLLQYFTNDIQAADISFGNAEGVFLDKGGVPKGSGEYVYCFRQPTRYAQYFTDNGFDMLSVANNHASDFGSTGTTSTIATLQSLPILFAGLQNHAVCSTTVRGIKIGMAAFAPHKGCIQLNDYAAAIASVKKLKSDCDIVIVSMHAGAEGRSATHVPKHAELFLGQNRGDVYKFAHAVIDAGADVVIGHGPHVPRAMELYKNKLIAYSLGNFCTYGMFNLENVSGIAPLLKIYLTTQGDFIGGQIRSIKQLGEGGPLPDENYSAYQLIKNLSATDFPDSKLRFPDSVSIVRDSL